MTTKNIKIEGMSCEHCVASLKKELSNLKDLVIKEVNIGTAEVEYDTNQISEETLKDSVETAGYKLVAIE